MTVKQKNGQLIKNVALKNSKGAFEPKTQRSFKCKLTSTLDIMLLLTRYKKLY